jgi:hypothetical protein
VLTTPTTICRLSQTRTGEPTGAFTVHGAISNALAAVEKLATSSATLSIKVFIEVSCRMPVVPGPGQ